MEPGTAVDVTVSLGPEQVEVPEVYGLSVAAAQTALSNAGLNSTPIEVEGDEPAGTALATDPGVGAMLDPGSTVTLYYSAGPPPATTASPDASSPPNSESHRKAPIGGPGRREHRRETRRRDNRPIDRNATIAPPRITAGQAAVVKAIVVRAAVVRAAVDLVAAEGRARKSGLGVRTPRE